MKKIHRDNFRVEVYPKRPWMGTCDEREWQSLCEDIKSNIKRHVDDIGQVYITSDETSVCSFCGYGWTEESDKYNGGCCAKDEDNNPNPPKDE